MEPINRYLDHAVLKPEMTLEQVKEAIQVGIDYRYARSAFIPYPLGAGNV